jgi:hypothetical protein
LLGCGPPRWNEHGFRLVGLKSHGHAEGIDASPEIAERLRFEVVLSDLAAGFINLEAERVDQAIEDCLRRIVEGLGL